MHSTGAPKHEGFFSAFHTFVSFVPPNLGTGQYSQCTTSAALVLHWCGTKVLDFFHKNTSCEPIVRFPRRFSAISICNRQCTSVETSGAVVEVRVDYPVFDLFSADGAICELPRTDLARFSLWSESRKPRRAISRRIPKRMSQRSR
jgi:hypothetical protein